MDRIGLLGYAGIHRPQRIERQKVLDIGDQELLVLLFVMQAQLYAGHAICIELLNQSPAVSLVLMDVMMPDMDGYEATRVIRGIAKYATLPIIALTAKAMKDDRARCIASGASDYIAKPVESEQLLSVLRVWFR